MADERQSGKVDYPLITMIRIVLLGSLCRCEGSLEISEWADFRRDDLATFLELEPISHLMKSHAGLCRSTHPARQRLPHNEWLAQFDEPIGT